MMKPNLKEALQVAMEDAKEWRDYAQRKYEFGLETSDDTDYWKSEMMAIQEVVEWLEMRIDQIESR